MKEHLQGTNLLNWNSWSADSRLLVSASKDSTMKVVFTASGGHCFCELLGSSVSSSFTASVYVCHHILRFLHVGALADVGHENAEAEGGSPRPC